MSYQSLNPATGKLLKKFDELTDGRANGSPSGAGGLGHLAIQYAKVMSLQVCAIDIDEGKLAHAKHLGADFVVNAKKGDPAEAVKKATNGGAQGVLITAPSLSAFKQGIDMTRKLGTCVLVGLPPRRVSGPAFRCGGQLYNYSRFLRRDAPRHGRNVRLAAEGKVKADIEMQPLSAINKAFNRLEQGDVPSRVVLEFT